MLDDQTDLAITRAIIGLGHTLGLRVVAEGVETQQEMEILCREGCDEFQCFFFAQPVPAEGFVAWVVASDAAGKLADAAPRNDAGGVVRDFKRK